MALNLCGEPRLFDFRDHCVRSFWSAIPPVILIISFCLFSVSLPWPRPVHKIYRSLQGPFQSFLTLPEAEALDLNASTGDEVLGDEDVGVRIPDVVSRWRAVAFALVGVVETLGWLSYASFRLFSSNDANMNIQLGVVFPLFIGVSWMYTIVRSVLKPLSTPPFDLLAIYTLHLVSGALQLGGAVFDHEVRGEPWPPTFILLGLSANFVVALGLVAIVMNMPLDVPSKRVRKEEIGLSASPEDYTTLFGWVSFAWVYPLVRRGRKTALNTSDVWTLSPTMQSRPLFIKFIAIQHSTLLRRLWAANSLDMILDCILTFVSVTFNYAGPFFLKLILDTIDIKNPTPESKAKAYVYAFVAFACSIIKTQADTQHLWFGRRAATRIRSELMAAIYEKALKRKDFSGTVREARRTADPLEAKNVQEEDEPPAAAADVGKIVNLMGVDTSAISKTVAGLYLMYGAPFEIVIAGTFLYQLLGPSAFAGLFVLVAVWPLNSYIANWNVNIQKGVSTARDRRMGVLDELIGAVKFIKFFAWEERWIGRVLDAREVEMKWMIKSRINSSLLYVLWTCAPTLVSVISFFVYVMQGNELTISVAFTSIALFNIVRQPLNVVPTWIIQILQTGIALERIALYLDEDEVTDQASTLKKDRSEPISSDSNDGLGIEKASFKWNEVGDPSGERGSTVHREGEITPDSNSETTLGHRFELRDISVVFPEGKLSVITGPTASGKTALLMALLGEMTLLPGKGRLIMSKNSSRIDENGFMHSISYAAQSPWLQHLSIKDNILFGHPYDEERYKAVVEFCALRSDLDMLEDGDETEIGARGVTLSGGQKARVALARAVYAQTKYVLLDDPLSAVDSHTSRFLFEQLLCGPLLAGRTVVLVTHHVELVLPGASYLVRMLDGRIDAQGTLEDLRQQGVLDEITHDAATQIYKEALQVALSKASEQEGEAEDGEHKTKSPRKPRKLVKDEHRETGGIQWSIYKRYLKASSYWIWVSLLVLVVVGQLLIVAEKLWIKTWGEAYNQPVRLSSIYALRSFATLNHGNNFVPTGQHYPSVFEFARVAPVSAAPSGDESQWPDAAQHPLFYISIYAAIGLANAMVVTLSAVAEYTGALRASRVFFRQLLVSVVRATFRFHDTTPQGRMLNRFGKDIETIDTFLAGSLQAVNISLANLLSSILIIVFVFPWFLIPATLLGIAYRQVALGYLITGRDLRRMESNTRSPILSDFGEMLEGIVTVRAFSAEGRLLDGLHRKVDTTTQMWYMFWMTSQWLVINLDTLGALAVLATTLFSITTLNDGGWAGICITSAMAFTSAVFCTCRLWTALELDLNSVERVVEYLDLPQEPPAIIQSHRVPAYWPSSTTTAPLISVNNLTIKYAPDLPPVLQGVSFDLGAGERVGLLGRTGSGKSTLAMSILRFVDPADGRILIDGIDISTIGIHDLRSRLTFIPQDATLFSGTLRDNLDPFGEHDDAECMDVLFRVQMINYTPPISRGVSLEPSAASSCVVSRGSSIRGKRRQYSNDRAESVSTATTRLDTITSGSTPTQLTYVLPTPSPISLATQVSPGGTNFSQGQRQLIAMARALLRRSSIVVLDEATSSIDFATDAKIQAIIREEFSGSLMLTVAHRLRTVIDYDRLIVLDKGQIVEFDTPWKLIQKEDGIFRGMCLKSGSFGELESAAKRKFDGDGSVDYEK